MPEAASRLTWFEDRSQDPEYAHDLLRKAYGDFTVEHTGSAERFAFSHEGVVAPGFTLARVRYSTSAGLDAHGSDTSLIIVRPRSGRIAAGARRDVVAGVAGVPLLMPTDRAHWWFEMDDVTEDVLRLDRAAVDRAAACAFGVGAGELSFSAPTVVPVPAARYWNGVLAHVERDVLSNAEAASSPLVLAGSTRLLATAALVTFPNSGQRLLEERAVVDGHAEPAVLRRALDYIDEHAAEDIGVDDIAAAARIGVRGLQMLFRRHRGRTPLEELRRARMARAHADLRAGDPTRGDRVATIAMRWGFSNPGRFAGQYRRAYGGSPNETLRR